MKWEFTDENMKKVREIMAKFPTNYKASAVMPLLTLAQEQNDNWLPLAAMNKIAQMLDMAPIRVYEVATFYSMYNREPLGKYHLQVCGTTPCMLCGSEKILATLEKHLGVEKGEITKDGLFTFTEVECLGACANAPMLQLNNHEFYENLDEQSTVRLVEQLRTEGIKATKVGPQSGKQRVAEGPQGKTTLKSEIDPTKGRRDIDALMKQVKEEQEKAKQAAAAAPKK
jgi:NADH dehydrogenase (ubiquinone) flavoprotein 2